MAKQILGKLNLWELSKSLRKGKGLMPSRPFKNKSKYNRKNKHRKDYE
jgi:hypothetical protein